MTSTALVAVLLVLVAPTLLPAQSVPAGGDPFAELLFAPDLILGHQQQIGLSSDQRDRIVAELSSAQAEFVELQVELASHGESLQAALAPSRVDEAEALAIAAAIMELESAIKQRHLSLAIRIKNELSGDQQRQLAAVREGG